MAKWHICAALRHVLIDGNEFIKLFSHIANGRTAKLDGWMDRWLADRLDADRWIGYIVYEN